MATMTLAEQFAPLLAGKYTGQPGTLWHTLERSWHWDSVLDVTEDSRVVEAPGGALDLTASLSDAIDEAIRGRDHVRLSILADQAEERGVDPELCDLTRRALRVQYP